MKNFKFGYLLIEVLIYLSGSALLLTVFMIMISNFYQYGLNHIWLINSHIEFYTGIGILQRNLRFINCNNIENIETDHINFTLEKLPCSWIYKNNNIIFSKNGNNSLVMYNIKKFRINDIMHDKKSLFMELVDNKGHKIESYISFRNGIII